MAARGYPDREGAVAGAVISGNRPGRPSWVMPRAALESLLRESGRL